MTEPEFLEPDVVLFLHDQALREYGGIQEVKSEDMLHSALERPVGKLARADPSDPDLFDLAAAYAYGLPATIPSTMATSGRPGAAVCCSSRRKASRWMRQPRMLSSRRFGWRLGASTNTVLQPGCGQAGAGEELHAGQDQLAGG